MAFGLFRKHLPEFGCARRRIGGRRPVTAADSPRALRTSDSAREILELLELELGAMIRQLERAADSVAGGAEATAATLATIRQRTDALTGRTSAAQSTATTFSQAADKFTHSARRHRLAGPRRQQACRSGRAAAREASAQCGPPARILGRHRQCRQPDRADRPADHAAGAQLHHRGGAGRRRRPRLRGGRHRGQGAGGADPARHRGNHQEDRRAAEGCRGFGRRRASDCAGDRGDPPGVRKRQRRGGRAERNHPRDGRKRRRRRRTSSFRSATAPPRSTARQRRPRPMASVSPPPARPSRRSRRSSKPAARCCWARTGARTGASANGCPATSRSRFRPRSGPITAAVYEISMEGILISGADAERLPLNAKPRRRAGRHRRLPDSRHRALQGRRAGAVRGAGCRA